MSNQCANAVDATRKVQPNRHDNSRWVNCLVFPFEADHKRQCIKGAGPTPTPLKMSQHHIGLQYGPKG